MTETARLVESASNACESVRALNHVAVGALPAPLVYDVLRNLKGVGHMLPQALRQLGEGLVASLAEYDVYDAEDADPGVNARRAHSGLMAACEHAARVGQLLGVAQSAISQQGYR